MNYLSTRSNTSFIDSAQAVLNGLAPDGGLYVPERLPELDVAACLQESTMEMAKRIIGSLLPDIPNMETLVKKAYTGKFQTEELTPTVDTGKFTVLELFRGPTSAFKDVALCKNAKELFGQFIKLFYFSFCKKLWNIHGARHSVVVFGSGI